jgi:hypothetical protein
MAIVIQIISQHTTSVNDKALPRWIGQATADTPDHAIDWI